MVMRVLEAGTCPATVATHPDDCWLFPAARRQKDLYNKIEMKKCPPVQKPIAAYCVDVEVISLIYIPAYKQKNEDACGRKNYENTTI